MSTAVAPTNTANIDTLDAEPSSVSRHGRVRKKNSLLAEYDSLDSLDKPRKKYEKEKTPRKEKGPGTPKVTLKIGSDDTPKRPMKKGPKGKKMTLMTSSLDSSFKSSGRNYLDDDDDDEGELEIDLPPEFQSSMPMLGAEEIIDEGLLDEEDGATEIAENTSINRLKSQAESTYFMEKSLEKGRKIFPGMPGLPGKVKQTRKDKGSSRVTAYMLWSKEQRSIFDKKNMSADFPQMSKKLSDLWATVPANQKKMWKNKAAKMMKKKANLNENMKNSGPGAKATAHFGAMKKTPPGPVKETNSKGLKKSSPHLVAVTAGTPSTTPAPKTTPKGVQNKSTAPTKAKTALPVTKVQTKVQTKAPGKGRPGGGASATPKSYFSPNSVDEKPSNVTMPKKGNRNFLNLNNGHSSKYSGAFQTKQQFSPRKDEDPVMYKVTGTAPLDVAAHFSLLGESLSIIGERLKEHEGQTVSGSLSVLLDSLLCACGPLLCLTQQVPELNVLPQDRLNRILDSIAYIMPGL